MNNRKKALLAVILGNAIFGFSFLFSKNVLNITVPSVLLAVRFSIAFIVLNFIALAFKIQKKENQFSLKGKPIRYVLLLGIFQPIIYFAAESYGITYTSSAFAGTIIAIVPIVGIIFDVLIMHVHVSKKQIICSVISVIGVIITTIGAQNMKSSVLGVIFLLIAVVAGALFYVFSKKSADYFNPLERTYVMFGMGSVFYVIFALVECHGMYHERIWIPLSNPNFWYSIIYLAIVSSVIAFMLLNYGSTKITVSEASLFANLTTVISIAAGIVIVKESFTMWQLIGAGLIIGSVYIANVNKTKEG